MSELQEEFGRFEKREVDYTITNKKAKVIVTGDGICLNCCGVKRHMVHCKVVCTECGTILENCNGD
jgi:hypothetical protein